MFSKRFDLSEVSFLFSFIFFVEQANQETVYETAARLLFMAVR